MRRCLVLGFRTRMARGVARKAGLRAIRGEPAQAQTVIDGYIHPQEGPYARQYLTDFSRVSRVRLASQSNVPVYVFCSPSVGSNELRPADYTVLRDVDGVPVSASIANSSGDLRYFTLPTDVRTPLRLTLSTSAGGVEMNSIRLDSPFSVALQAH